MCRANSADWEEFKEQRSRRPVSNKLLDWDKSLEDEDGSKALVVRGKSTLEAGKAWAVLMVCQSSCITQGRGPQLAAGSAERCLCSTLASLDTC